LVARELGGRVSDARPLTPARPAMTWAARVRGIGPIVVKVRGTDADAKTRWCAQHLPVLRARRYPVPTILWHGMLGSEWHVTAQNLLPGRPLRILDGPLLDSAVNLVELQADAGIPAGDRDFTSYVAHVLFDDWDEFGLGSRALDLVALAVDCERHGGHAAADHLLAHATRVAGADGAALPGQLSRDRPARPHRSLWPGLRRRVGGRGVHGHLGDPGPARVAVH
jgi:hypothetical protein